MRIAAIEEAIRNLADTSDAMDSHRTCSAVNDAPPAASLATASRATEEMIAKQYAPPGMEEAFQQLYRVLLPCLSGRKQEQRRHRSNASVFVQGPRGCGKSLLVQACLRAIRAEEPTSQFRPVFCTSILHVPYQRHQPNAGAAAVVEEILRQLVDQAAQTPASSSSGLRGDLMRLQKTSFTNHLQLLNEILQMASADGFPVLFVLDNVPQFPPLLLYHLLDRVTGSGTASGFSTSSTPYSLGLIGMTTHSLTSLQTSGFVEKRIVSRMEGTSSMILLPPLSCSSQELLRSKLPPTLHASVSQTYEDPDLRDSLIRQERLGQSARWFCRLFTLALASWREDARRQGARKVDDSLLGSYVREALDDFGIAPNADSESAKKRSRPSPARHVLQDLSIPQLLLVLAARRILDRSHRSKSSSSDRASGTTVALTLQGMMAEVTDRLYRGSPPPNATAVVLKQAFLDLTEMAVLRPACDHSGTGPFQYYERENVLECASWEVILRVPLHMTLDIYRDVLPALENHELPAPSAIIEWGKKLS
jgi:hypothetical protein